MHKLSVQAPPKLTVEKYLVEIAKYYNVDYEPDTQVSDSQYWCPVGLCALSFFSRVLSGLDPRPGRDLRRRGPDRARPRSRAPAAQQK